MARAGPRPRGTLHNEGPGSLRWCCVRPLPPLLSPLAINRDVLKTARDASAAETSPGRSVMVAGGGTRRSVMAAGGGAPPIDALGARPFLPPSVLGPPRLGKMAAPVAAGL